MVLANKGVLNSKGVLDFGGCTSMEKYPNAYDMPYETSAKARLEM